MWRGRRVWFGGEKKPSTRYKVRSIEVRRNGVARGGGAQSGDDVRELNLCARGGGTHVVGGAVTKCSRGTNIRHT